MANIDDGPAPEATPVPRGAARAHAAAERRRRTVHAGVLFLLMAAAALVVIGVAGNQPRRPGGIGGNGNPAATNSPSPAAPGGAFEGFQAVGGARVPDFCAASLEGGNPLCWKDFRGSPTVVVVWAPWCPHCQVELPRMGKVAADFPRVKVLTIVTSVGTHPGPDPAQFMRDNALTFPVMADDAQSTLQKGFGVTGFPMVLWIGSDGLVKGVVSGESSEENLRTSFAALSDL